MAEEAPSAGLSRTHAGALLAVVYAAVLTSQVMMPKLFLFVWCGVLYAWVLLMTVWYVGCAKAPDAGKAKPAGSVVPDEGEGKRLLAAVRKPRMLYLDHFKTMLTMLVIAHHTACCYIGYGWYYVVGGYTNYFRAFGGAFTLIDQAYFMCVFFFVSGYFTPSSYDRKGKVLFLKDKYKRLGIPFLVWVGVVSQLLCLLAQPLASWPHMKYNPIPSAGQMWFVGWLLLYNHLYAVTDHSAPLALDFPQPWVLLAASAVLTAGSLGLMYSPMGTLLAYSPVSVGSCLFYPFFFYGGCAAKRNHWLDEATRHGLTAAASAHRGWMTAAVGVAVAGMFAYPLYWSHEHYVTFEEGARNQSTGPTLFPTTNWEYTLVMFVCCTLLTALMPLVQLDWFRRSFNASTELSQRLSAASYTAYIIHPFVSVASTAAFVQFYEAVTGHAVAFVPKTLRSETVLESEAWLWCGWAVSVLTVIPVTYLFAHVFREYVPGAKSIL
eukprot:TRINITY_DN29718_c0_g1_i1.p1 TRINITY_DN29718_c0_g1~~TRINITY_DN29718_c0_g1_i1.p1  ORF type:complete len:492 (+),score=139.96 TRINITY_DN29718_c0_g1_i1:52-1527(+)